MKGFIGSWRSLPAWFFRQKRITQSGIVVLIIILSIMLYATSRKSSSKAQVQTQNVEKGTIVQSTTVSGQVVNTHAISITTHATGSVKTVFVKDGDVVKVGQKIAELELDLYGRQKAAQALASFQAAQNALEAAKTKQFTLQAQLFGQWDEYKSLAENGMYSNGDGSPNASHRQLPEFLVSQNEWLATEAEYKSQQQVISQLQTSLSSAWLTYQQTSSTIYAPLSGTVTGMSLQVGSIVGTTTADDTKVASVMTAAKPAITLNLTEIDVQTVKVGNKATVTFDAIADKTYTGVVLSIDKVGTVNSGVTTYPTVVQLDEDIPELLPNMAASAAIITAIRTDVLRIPSSTIETQNEMSFVTLMKDKHQERVMVQTGLTSDTYTEILNGVSEGDTIVTGSSQQTIQINNQPGQSPFSPGGMGRFRGGSGGNQIFVAR